MLRMFAFLTIAVMAGLQAQTTVLRGPELSDMNRSVDPCVDFYEFANGRWRSENPIPPAMARWSRRWAAGESAKGRLHEILNQAAPPPSVPKGAVDQLIGDFYGACPDEARINELGVKPLAPLLEEIG